MEKSRKTFLKKKPAPHTSRTAKMRDSNVVKGTPLSGFRVEGQKTEFAVDSLLVQLETAL
jgi:hypothetical protein